METILDQLNNYIGDNIWQDVIWGLTDLDQDRCWEGDGMTIYFLDGSQIRY